MSCSLLNNHRTVPVQSGLHESAHKKLLVPPAGISDPLLTRLSVSKWWTVVWIWTQMKTKIDGFIKVSIFSLPLSRFVHTVYV